MLNLHQILTITGKLLKDNAPAILTSVSIVGTVSTAVMAVKATPDALDRIQQAEEKKFEANPEGGPGSSRLTVWETAKATYPCYIPAFAIGVVSITCMLGAQSINMRRQAALLGGLALTEKAFSEYQEKVATTIGEGKAEKIRNEVIEDRMRHHPPTDAEVYIANDTDVLCYDKGSDRYFHSDMETIRSVQNTINQEVLNNMYATQTMFFEMLDLKKTDTSDEFGWDTSRMLDIHYGGHINGKTGKPCISIEYRMRPVADFHSFG
jgi:hypothetical protein